jgi:hypothetical protein
MSAEARQEGGETRVGVSRILFHGCLPVSLRLAFHLPPSTSHDLRASGAFSALTLDLTGIAV